MQLWPIGICIVQNASIFHLFVQSMSSNANVSILQNMQPFIGSVTVAATNQPNDVSKL